MNLTDLSIRRQVLLERFKTAEVRKFTPILAKIDAEIRRQLSGTRLTDFRRARLEQQLAGMRTVLEGHYGEYARVLNADLQGLAVDSVNYEAASFRSVLAAGGDVAIPAPGQLWAAVQAQPLTMTGANGGVILESFMREWGTKDAETVTNAVRMGYALGETNDQILARIRGSSALNYADGVLATSRRHAETVARTAIQHVANSARAEMWAANSDIVDEYQWVSTLDSRTTPICRDRDLEKFPVGAGPLPPAHPNCRSTTVAVIGGEFGRFLDEETGERASVDGGAPAGQSYYDWLKTQDPDFQDVALGPTRGKLFRDGGLSSEEFSRLQLGKNFEPMTLDEMRRLEPGAFAKAGIGARPLAAPMSQAEALSAWDSDLLTSAIPEFAAESVERYAGNAYKEINRFLRTGAHSGRYDTAELAKWADDLDRALTESTVAGTVSLYRGMNAESLVDAVIARRFGGDKLGAGWDYFNNFKPADLVGEVFEDASFMSFSVKQDTAVRFSGGSRTAVVFRIVAPKGSTGYMSPSGAFGVVRGEYEVIRKGGRFRIVGWDEEAGVLDIEPLP